MSYSIEIGQLAPSKQEYSYGRRAQAVTHLLRWRQVAIAQSEKAAMEYAELLADSPDYKSCGIRIEFLANTSEPGKTITVRSC